jgi:glycosyltransferase 2 family protein
MSRTAWRWGRLIGSVLTLAILVWRLGTGPFLDGVRSVDGRALAAAAGIALLTTVCCAWRWTIVARGFGVTLSLPGAVAAYYRSQFLNVTLPGGVVGDIHRGVSHGRDVRDVGGALRAVVWERFAGQAVQAVITVFVLLTLPSPVHASMPLVAIAVVVVAIAAVLVARARDIRVPRLTRRAWFGIAVASGLVVGGHAVSFLIAARTVGNMVTPTQMLPIALLVMMAMVLPSAAGWGPREGVTAWAFGAAGLGAQQGVETAVVYGVMVFVASLPGAAMLIVGWFRRTRLPHRTGSPLREQPVHA